LTICSGFTNSGGTVEPSKVANHHYSNSVKVTTPLVSISESVLEAHDETMFVKQDILQSNCKVVKDKFDDIYKIEHVFEEMCRYSRAPLLGFLLSLSRNTVMLCTSEHLLMQYVSVMDGDLLTFPPIVCRKLFTVEPALSCSFGAGFPYYQTQ